MMLLKTSLELTRTLLGCGRIVAEEVLDKHMPVAVRAVAGL
jgi:hypothetical protein